MLRFLFLEEMCVLILSKRVCKKTKFLPIVVEGAERHVGKVGNTWKNLWCIASIRVSAALKSYKLICMCVFSGLRACVRAGGRAGGRA